MRIYLSCFGAHAPAVSLSPELPSPPSPSPNHLFTTSHRRSLAFCTLFSPAYLTSFTLLIISIAFEHIGAQLPFRAFSLTKLSPISDPAANVLNALFSFDSKIRDQGTSPAPASASRNTRMSLSRRLSAVWMLSNGYQQTPCVTVHYNAANMSQSLQWQAQQSSVLRHRSSSSSRLLAQKTPRLPRAILRSAPSPSLMVIRTLTVMALASWNIPGPMT